MRDKLNIVFMGTPDFSVPCLHALAKSGHRVQAVFTQPDKPKGRGYKLIPTPVKAAAQAYGIPVYQPLSLRKGEDAARALETLRALQPDLIVVVAYGQILPVGVLELPAFGCVNIHASLLPKYRGAAPIQWCILNGETETGVTSMQMAQGLDTGDMLLAESLSIGEEETSGQLHDRLSELGAKVLLETVAGICQGTLTPVPQDDALSCYASMIRKDMSRIDFTKPAREIHNLIRGITGFAFLGGKRHKLLRSALSQRTADPALAGTIVDAKDLTIACGDGHCIRILELQAEGGKRLKTEDFLRGNSIENGMKFETEVL